MEFICVIFRSAFFFFFKQKTAYEMRISDWSSDVCSSDLRFEHLARPAKGRLAKGGETLACPVAQRREARVHVGRRAAPMILAADDQQVGFGIERLETDVVIGFEAVPEERVGGRSGGNGAGDR